MATPPTFSVGSVLTAAQMNKVGSWLITTTSFTAQSTVSVNNCFTSDYTHYEILVSLYGSASSFCTLRMRAGGVDTAGTAYNRRGFYNVGGGPVNYSGTGESNMFFCQYGNASTSPGFTTATIANPQLAVRTVAFIQNMDSSVYDQYQIVDTVANNTQYDGFTLTPNSGTLSGTISVYGLRI